MTTWILSFALALVLGLALWGIILVVDWLGTHYPRVAVALFITAIWAILTFTVRGVLNQVTP